MSFRHDSRGVDTNMSSINLIPDGWYAMKIFDADERKSGKGFDQILVKCSVINNEEYKSAEIWHYVTFSPKDEKGAGISVHFRKCIGVPYGGDDIVDAEDWLGRKFYAHIVRDTYEGKTRNKFKEIEALDEAKLGEQKKDEVPF